MNNKFKVILIVVILLCAAGSTFALEYSAGEYFLRISEDSGRFGVYYGGDDGALFFTDNPRTSSLSFKYDDTVVRLGDEKQTQLSIQEYENAVVVAYDLPDIRIETSFSFLGSGDSVLGMAIDFRVVNRGENTFSSSLRQIIDTTLGESRAAHFSSSNGTSISGEYSFSPNREEYSILSSNGTRGVEFFVSAGGATAATRVVAANWKRLNESTWDFLHSQNRNFNLLPFSINDSALAFHYGPIELAAQESAEYRLVLSGYNDTSNRISASALANAEPINFIVNAESSIPLADAGVSDAIDTTTENQTYTPAEIEKLRPFIQDIETLDVLLEQIDRLLYSRSSLSSEEVEALKQILETIRQNSN